MNKPEPKLFKTFLQDKFKTINDELRKIVIDEKNTDSKGIITNANDSLEALKSVLQIWASLIGFQYVKLTSEKPSVYKKDLAIFQYDKDKLEKDSDFFKKKLSKKAEDMFKEIVYDNPIKYTFK